MQKGIHGPEEMPDGMEVKSRLALELPCIAVEVFESGIDAREFYLCYAPNRSLFFVVETEIKKRMKQKYRPQFGAKGNDEGSTDYDLIVWTYKIDSLLC